MYDRDFEELIKLVKSLFGPNWNLSVSKDPVDRTFACSVYCDFKVNPNTAPEGMTLFINELQKIRKELHV